MKYNSSRFMCLNCGRESIPLSRKDGQARATGHRKALYCPWCKETVNHYEVHSDEDIAEFKEAFENGEFEDEAKESIAVIKSERRLI